MATHRIMILGPNTLPDQSGNVFYEPYSLKATNDFWKHGIFIFNDTATKDSLYGAFLIPVNYVGTAKIYAYWTSTATSGNVVWEFAYRAIAGDDAESLDQATAIESPTVTDAAPSATDRLLVASITLTSANLSANELCEFKFSRDGSSGSDTMTAAAQLHALVFEYADA